MPQLTEHQAYLNLISPLKRRRVVPGAPVVHFAHAPSYAEYRGSTVEAIAAPHSFVDDALLAVCQEQARLQLSRRQLDDYRRCRLNASSSAVRVPNISS
eukprot:scaffold127222_cov36-Prasinocladus_malaysianus.AAC.1